MNFTKRKNLGISKKKNGKFLNFRKRNFIVVKFKILHFCEIHKFSNFVKFTSFPKCFSVNFTKKKICEFYKHEKFVISKK